MGLIKGFQAANTVGKLAFVILLVAELLNWLCFTLNDWGLMDTQIENDGNKIGYGVWKLCGNQEPNPNCQDLDGWRLPWYGAFQAFCIFGFMGVNVAFVMTILMLFVPQCLSNREVGLFCAISCIVSVVCYIIAIIIFAARWDDTYDQGFDRETFGAGFFLAIVVVVLSVIAAICAIIGVRGQQQIESSSTSGPATEEAPQETNVKTSTKK
ncbi:hypothetical protein EGW08_016657 [Elysia chlorotica]|uniref:MARVEL domain-containing protein n=1 Tax=Elysia chlorotica TaxID=188477 RepID=A0A3S1B9Y4_ELYCH|nr:hypothetical protein EGW08_016657 [Elysia chlorotica]